MSIHSSLVFGSPINNTKLKLTQTRTRQLFTMNNISTIVNRQNKKIESIKGIINSPKTSCGCGH
jgi:hypothetical protein